MTIYKINIQEPYFSFIACGQKIIEGRLNKGIFKKLKAGDMLNINGIADFKIIRITKFKNFLEMLNGEGVKNVIPDKISALEAVNVYYKFYTKEDEKKFGVLAIKIKNLSQK